VLEKRRFIVGAVLIAAAVSYLIYAGVRTTSMYYFNLDEFLSRARLRLAKLAGSRNTQLLQNGGSHASCSLASYTARGARRGGVALNGCTCHRSWAWSRATRCAPPSRARAPRSTS